MTTAQQLIDECEQETYAKPLKSTLKDEIRTAEFLGNSRDKFKN